MNYVYYYIYLLFIIILCLYSSFLIKKTQENFTPGIRRLYRPYLREARILSENYFKDSNNTFNSFLRKTGLY